MEPFPNSQMDLDSLLLIANNQKFYDNKKYDIVRERVIQNELQAPLYKLMSDVFFLKL